MYNTCSPTPLHPVTLSELSPEAVLTEGLQNDVSSPDSAPDMNNTSNNNRRDIIYNNNNNK